MAESEIGMCILCLEWEKGKLTLEEALKNFGEIRASLGEEHEEELADKLQIEILKEWVSKNYI